MVDADAALVSGRVVHADGRPAPGAEVSALGTALRTLSGEGGAFALAVDAGAARLSATLGDESGAMPATFVVVRGRAVGGVVLTLSAAGGFEGRVVADTGPVAGARVVAVASAMEDDWRHLVKRAPTAETTTDARGAFRLGGLAPGPWSVAANATGFLQASAYQLGLRAGQRYPVELRLVRAAAVEGAVVDEGGHPVADALVGDRFSRTRSGTDGRYRLSDLGPGERTFSARRGANVARGVVELAAGRVARLDFTLPAPGTLAGTISTHAGAPVAARVRVLQGLNADNPNVVADRAGRYELHLAPGAYEVSASFGATSAHRESVAVTAGATTTLDLGLSDEAAAPRAIEGVVLAPDGTPAEGARISAHDPSGALFLPKAEGAGEVHVSTVADADGRFALRLDGPADLDAVRADAFAVSGPLAPGTTGVVLTLAPGASVVGRLRGWTGEYTVVVEPRAPHPFDARGDRLTFVGETFALSGVPPLPSTVRVHAGALDASADVELRPGETTDVDLRLRSNPAVTGRVVDAATKKPLAKSGITTGALTAFADADGRFSLTLEPGEHEVHVFSDRHFTETLDVNLVAPGVDLGEILLRPLGGARP